MSEAATLTKTQMLARARLESALHQLVQAASDCQEAGLEFGPEMLRALEAAGVEIPAPLRMML